MVEINHAIKRNGEVPDDIKQKSLRKLFVGGLGSDTTREDLVEHFSQFGPVLNAYVIYDPISKQSKNFGYVEFAKAEDTSKAATHNSHLINGKKASVQFFKLKESQQAKKGTDAPEAKAKPEGYGISHGLYSGKGLYAQRGRYPDIENQFPIVPMPYGSHYCPQNLHYDSQTNNNVTRSQNLPIVQPQRPILFEKQRAQEFYMSLRIADEARYYAHTYSPFNLRFNRLKSN